MTSHPAPATTAEILGSAVDAELAEASTSPQLPDTADRAVPDAATGDHSAVAVAVVTITELGGMTARFRTPDGDPRYLIPVIAHSILWADQHELPLTLATWHAYLATFHGTVDAHPLAPQELAAGGSDYDYELVLQPDERAVLLQVCSLRGPGGRPRRRVEFELTRAGLFIEAAVLCDLMADRAERWAADHGGAALVGNEPAVWRRHEARFRAVHASPPVAALAATFAARVEPARFPAVAPSVDIAGARVAVGIAPDTTVTITAELERTERWLLRPDGTVPLRVQVNGVVVFAG